MYNYNGPTAEEIKAEVDGKKMIINYVDEKDRRPSSDNIDLPDACLLNVDDLFKELLNDKYIIKNVYKPKEPIEFTCKEELDQAKKEAGFREYSVVKYL